MPFIPQEDRTRIDNGESPSTPGERCYVYYKELVKRWKLNPRWTTAHEMYKELIQFRDYYHGTTNVRPEQKASFFANCLSELTARELAWQVFFNRYVMPYEDDKEKLNGTI